LPALEVSLSLSIFHCRFGSPVIGSGTTFRDARGSNFLDYFTHR
jgi:hypothetical protein